MTSASHAEDQFDYGRKKINKYLFIYLFIYVNAPIVQWLEYAVANGVARVRFPVGAKNIYLFFFFILKYH